MVFLTKIYDELKSEKFYRKFVEVQREDKRYLIEDPFKN